MAAWCIDGVYSARCYARDYLRLIGNGNENLLSAANHYENVTCSLKPIWEFHRFRRTPDSETFRKFIQGIRKTKEAEEICIGYLKKAKREIQP
jgi:hypothetical protein